MATQVVFSSDIHFEDGIVYAARNITDSTASPYQLTEQSGPYGGKDFMITISTENPITIYLPTDSQNGCENGRSYFFTSAITNSIDLTIDGLDHNINGTDVALINGADKSLELMFTHATSEWHII